MKILFYGDSNTWGYQPTSKSRLEQRYTQLIKQSLPEHEILEEGLCGRTMCYDDPFDADRNGLKSISMVLKTHNPIDVVFIMLGTNDAKRQFFSNAISLEKGIRALLYKALNPEVYRDVDQIPTFIVVCPPKMHPKGLENSRILANFGQEGFDMLQNTKPYLEKGCQNFHVEVIDTQAIAGTFDGIHMDEEGHKKVAEVLISRIKEIERTKIK